MREYLLNLMDILEYPEESKPSLISAYDKIMANADCTKQFDELIKIYENDCNCNYDSILKQCSVIANEAGIHEYEAQLLIFMCFSKHLKELYKEQGISEKIWRNSMLDLKYKLLECKAVKDIWGSFVAWWFPGFFNVTRFGLGRLQFEISTFDKDGYEKDGKKLKKGDKVVNIHIPRTLTPLDKESCEDALAQAREFYKDKLDGAPMAFICFSWLLYPDYDNVFIPGTNTYRFKSYFDIIGRYDDKPENPYADMWRLFDMDYTGNIDDYPEDSSLRRALKNYLKNGGKTGEGYGIFFA
ncbi:MAG: DUF5596 domain-containing protein [Clostridia bacterium]|nr:DUF5596 domain-containing protein [Clostridia bacterium]